VARADYPLGPGSAEKRTSSRNAVNAEDACSVGPCDTPARERVREQCEGSSWRSKLPTTRSSCALATSAVALKKCGYCSTPPRNVFIAGSNTHTTPPNDVPDSGVTTHTSFT
jgi:hypothetical protein